jgi:hypothetical protein
MTARVSAKISARGDSIGAGKPRSQNRDLGHPPAFLPD